MIAGRLTMRAHVERNQAAATGGDWGGAAAPDFQPHGVLPCFVYSKSGRAIEDGKKLADIEQLRIMVGKNADLKPGDEIAQVTNRAGEVLYPDRLRIDGPVQLKHTHREAALEVVS